jgi:glycosyltransferase involved in cell wall biosynthesis
MSERVLIICHNDPRLHPGGTETVAYELYRTLNETAGLEAYFLACVDRLHRARSSGTALQSVAGREREFLLWTSGYDLFCHAQVDHHGVVPELAELLLLLRPGVVHLHHYILFGLDLVALIRRLLPTCRIVLTLHDYSLICAHDGVMMTADGRLCSEAVADACVQCVPKSTLTAFKLRELFLRGHLALVDVFTVPSAFARDRYLQWGVPADKLHLVRNGRRWSTSVSARALTEGERRSRFAVFGNISPRKGQLLAVAAAELARRRHADLTLSLHGAPLFQEAEVVSRLTEAVGRLTEGLVLTGEYQPSQVAALMAGCDWVIVPSLWWENAPLVIEEAFHHGRPVICSDVGGMAERLAQGGGLVFERGNAAALAAAMSTAMDPEVWDRCRCSIPPVRTDQDMAREFRALYRPTEA